MIALLRLAPHDERFAMRNLLIEMVIAAWAPAALYRLSFGPHDRLQDLVRTLQTDARLSANTTENRVRSALKAWPSSTARLEALGRYVPGRFLAPWHAEGLPNSVQDEHRNRLLIERSQLRQGSASAGPYAIFGQGLDAQIVLEPSWREWLLENLLIVRCFTELELARFLQARNPHVPGVVDKVRPPGQRKLASARRSFERLRVAEGGLSDLFTGRPLADGYAIDHFLPRAFVAHDLIWNLAPTAHAINLDKADQLPHSAFVRRLASLHFRLIKLGPVGSDQSLDYAAALGTDTRSLMVASLVEFNGLFEDFLRPLFQIASNQGFRANWRPAGGAADRPED